jgi:sec-independent protein translocase protein TatB
MFDIGGLELLLITVVALLVIGPERLPEALRTLGLWLGRLRRSFTSVKAEIEKEIGMDEVRRQLHNESVMEEMKRIEREVQNTVNEAKIDPNLGAPTNQPSNQPRNPITDPDPDLNTTPSRHDVSEPVAPNTEGATQAEPADEDHSSSATEPADNPAEKSAVTEPAIEPYEAPPAVPKSEAEVEAAFERKMRAGTKEQP